VSTSDVRLAAAFDVAAGATLAATLAARGDAIAGACLAGALVVAGALTLLRIRVVVLVAAVAYFGVGVFLALGTATDLIEWRRLVGYGVFAACSAGAYVNLRAWAALRSDRGTGGRAGPVTAGR
jgi:hypothetical protein